MAIAEKYLPNYTYCDYTNWKGNWEIIEGIPFSKISSFTPIHQIPIGALAIILQKSLKRCITKFYTYMAIDWVIKDDTVIQPDLIIVSKLVENNYLDFSPCLIVEVISDSSNLIDRGLKFEIYEAQKVKYYLIVDPLFKKIEVYELINNKYEPVAVNPLNHDFLLEENCTITTDFEGIWE